MNWSPQQESAIKAVQQWMRSTEQVFYLAGYAGVGKTTLAKHLVDPDRWLFASFTGKAALVLRQRGCLYAQTIHSLIYRPAGESRAKELATLNQRENILMAMIADLTEKMKAGDSSIDARLKQRQEELVRVKAQTKKMSEENRPAFDLWAGSPLADPRLDGLVVDEVSMVDQRVGQDLLSFGKKVLVLGDPAQLPPVGGGGFFTARTPDVLLTEIHRHAKDSGILRLATKVREGGVPDKSDCADDVLVMPVDGRRQDRVQEQVMAVEQAICGRNMTRHALNKRIRELRGFFGGPWGKQSLKDGPLPRERVVCLRNDRELGMLNGQQYEVIDSIGGGDTIDLHLRDEDSGNEVACTSWAHHFLGRGDDLKSFGHRRRDNMEVDWGYALTCHKAQGSQWKSICVFDEGSSFNADARRWRYTAVTRASKRLVVVL